MMYKVITTLSKISMPWFIELEKSNSKIHSDKQKIQIITGILHRKTDAGGITISDLQMYYRVIATKVMTQQGTFRPIE